MQKKEEFRQILVVFDWFSGDLGQKSLENS